ncbi:MAG TPA: T9SS type A sorting domain-containing protein [Chitinophagaceae bacterium]
MKRGLLILFIALSINATVFAQTNTWDGSNGTNWNTAANWSLNLVPTSAHDVVININATIDVDATPPNLKSLTINGNATVSFTCSGADRTITITNTGTGFSIANGSSLTLNGQNAGGGRSMNIAFAAATVTSNIAGRLTLNTSGAGSSFNATNSNTTVTGIITNNTGLFTSTMANLSFGSGGTYVHAVNGNAIPAAVWNATSNCNITGITNTAPSGLNQSFGNFTWDCAGHSALISLNSQLSTINGDFTVKYAGQANPGNGRTQNGLSLSTNTDLTLNIGGNMIIDHYASNATWLILTTGTANVTVNVAGNFNMSLTGSGTCFFDYYVGTTLNSLVMNIAGNFNQTGGYFDWTFYPTATGSNYTVMNLYGNFSQTGNSIMVTSTTDAGTPNGKIYFRKTGTQTIYASTPANVAYTNFDVQSGTTLEMLSSLYLYSSTNAPWGGQFVVNGGATLDLNTYQLLSSVAPGSNNAFTLNSTANVITANVNGLQSTTVGSVSTSIATRTYSSGANYTYDAVALQNSGTFITSPVVNQVNNLTINNTAGVNTTGVTLQQEFKVASVCTFLSGVFTTTNTNILTINNNATIIGADLDVTSTKYVNGPLKKIGNQPFAFAVGKISHGCRPIYISQPSDVTDEFRAELIRGNAGLLGPITAAGLERVSACEYWYLDRLVGSSNVDVSLSWSGESPCNAQSYVTDLPNLVVAHFNGTSWDAYGNDGGTTGNAVKGTVTWNNVSTFSPFSLGSLVWWSNPLTVKFINLQAHEKSGQVKVEWGNIAETGVDKYFVEYSTDGRSFVEINNTTARKNNGERTDYSWWHTTPANGIIYYRIKAIEFAGDVSYSHVVRLDLNKNNSGITVYPNPVKGNNVNITLSGLGEGKYDIIVLTMSGQKIMQRSLNHAGGSISMQVDLPETIKSGLYSIKLSGS